ncbi:MAG: hypothetical protein ACQESR_31400, partial [Planctomycetota bacterium]
GWLSERQDAFPLQKTRIASGASVPDDSEARGIRRGIQGRWRHMIDQDEEEEETRFRGELKGP